MRVYVVKAPMTSIKALKALSVSHNVLVVMDRLCIWLLEIGFSFKTCRL